MRSPFNLGFMKSAALSLGIAAALSPAVRAEEPLPHAERLLSSPVLRGLVPNPAIKNPRTGPEQTVAQMHVRPGFSVQLVLAEPDLHQPIAFTFDERGRLWVAEAYNYPRRAPEGEGSDKIVVFEDVNGDGKFEHRKVFAEGLNLVSGLQVGHGGVWVGAAPYLLFIPDHDGNDIPDGPPEILLDGFGYQDTHECLNNFIWGPDGWLYGNQGVFNHARIGAPGTPDDQRQELRAGVWRYHPYRRKFEVFAEGGSNQWGLDFDERGQLFMTHCRSYWGRGPTTHVIQGGRFWNQANANHAPFIIPNPPRDFPDFRNYLLSSARYDHGAGGAGVAGSDAIYGGHSHVGTMIYLGDNWPAEYRGHLFTHNLHGHQINRQANTKLGSGFDTVHAGQDLLFCTDPKYVAVDLQYGPDGAVYIIDWYDQQHCHNPNTERWDRSNGRIYRLQWDETYQPVNVDLRTRSDAELAGLQRHKNEWFARTARRLLQERAQVRPLRISPAQVSEFEKDPDPVIRLRAFWARHVTGSLNQLRFEQAFRDSDPYIRAWAIQLALEKPGTFVGFHSTLASMARTDPSPVVRLYLASAIQRLPAPQAWEVARALALRGEDRGDRNLPYLLWHGIAPLMPDHLDQAFDLAATTLIPQLADWIYWYAATLETGNGLERVIDLLAAADPADQLRLLAGAALALRNRADAPMPRPWRAAGPRLYSHPERAVQRRAEEVGASFGDRSILPRLRSTLADAGAPVEDREHAFRVLDRAGDAESLPILLQLVDDRHFRGEALARLARFNSPEVPLALISRLDSFSIEHRNSALSALTSRPAYAHALLDAIEQEGVKRDYISAFHVRQLLALNVPEIERRVTASWGRINQTPEEKQRLIDTLEKVFNEAPLWAYDTSAGRQLYLNLCAQCHKLGQDGTQLGPDLTGAGRNGIRYYLENIIDPNAVVGSDFQVTHVETGRGDLISGLLASETPTTVTIRTATGEVTVAKAGIISRRTTENSMMPEGLIEPLDEREQLELLKFLTSR